VLELEDVLVVIEEGDTVSVEVKVTDVTGVTGVNASGGTNTLGG